MVNRTLGVTAGGLVLAVSVTACGSSGASSDSPPSSAAPSRGPVAAASPSAPQGAASPDGGHMVATAMLMAKKTKVLGDIVTDHGGFTLYRYAKDMKGMSMCTGTCTKRWMPLMPKGRPQGMGVSAKLISTITRSDGMKQLALGGWPLYRYMGDVKPGQWKGQGMNGAWSAVAPSGKKSMGGMKMGLGGRGARSVGR
jgi:predicted lipoprotein with Yx(FWY)xxD motif